MTPVIHSHHWPGDPDRPALALHCMLASGSYWGPVARALHGRIDLRGFDLPGHGRSGPWQPGPDLPDFHTAVTRIAAGFIQRPLDLIGHSIGATVALRIAVAAPEAIRSLTLVEPVLFAAAPSEEQAELDRRMARHLAEGHRDQAARLFLDVWGHQAYDAMPAMFQQRIRDQIPLVAASDEILNRDGANILREGGLEAIQAPVLLVSGAGSPPVVHAIADALAARLPDVGRATVPDAAHMLPITHPQVMADLIGLNLDRA